MSIMSRSFFTPFSMTAVEKRVVVPGDIIGNSNEYIPGDGAFERHGTLFAALVGVRHVLPPSEEGQKPTLSVTRIDEKPTLVPKLGDVVLGKVSLFVIHTSLDLSSIDFSKLGHKSFHKIRQTSNFNY